MDLMTLQLELSAMGVDPGAADGVFEPLTRAAVAAVVSEAGIERWPSWSWARRLIAAANRAGRPSGLYRHLRQAKPAQDVGDDRPRRGHRPQRPGLRQCRQPNRVSLGRGVPERAGGRLQPGAHRCGRWRVRRATDLDVRRPAALPRPPGVRRELVVLPDLAP